MIGLTFVGDDGLDHVNFYKLVKKLDDTFDLFDFGIDVIQTIIFPSKRTLEDKVQNFGAGGPTLQNGNFIWTTSEE